MSVQNINLVLIKAVELLKQNNLIESKKIISELLKTHPKNFFALNIMGAIHDSSGEYQQALNSYNKAIEIKSDYSEAWSNKAMTLYKLKHFNEAIDHYSKVIELKSDNAETWYNRGLIYQELKKYELAIHDYNKAIELIPNYHQAWCNKGNILFALRDYSCALEYYNKALQIKPNYPEALSNKGNALHWLNRFDDALNCYDKAIQIKPDYVEAWSNKGNTLHELGRYDEAIKHYDKAISINPNYAQAYSNKSHTKLLTGDFEDGWKLFDYRWKKKIFQEYRHSQINLLTSLENISGKKILVWCEQGLGDVVHFSRYIKKLINLKAIITFEIQEDLKKFFDGHFDCEITSKTEKHLKFDFQIPLLSLPKLFKTNIFNIPQSNTIKINSKLTDSIKKKLSISSKKTNIGFAITGNPDHKHNKKRSIPINFFKPLLNFGNFFLIQKEITKTDINFITLNKEIIFVGNQINNFLDTASIVDSMDLIISVDTSLIHLAGILSKRSFLLLSSSPDWRWLLNRDDSPWYPSVRIIRQKSYGNWESVIDQLTKELEK